jgi:hypothetical protein
MLRNPLVLESYTTHLSIGFGLQSNKDCEAAWLEVPIRSPYLIIRHTVTAVVTR